VLLEKPLGSVIREMGLDVRESELDQMRRGITDVFATGETSTVEMSLPFPAGRRYFSVGFFPERDVHGSVIHVMAIAHDITERKQAEDTLRQNEDRIRLVIDTIPIMAWSIGKTADSILPIGAGWNMRAFRWRRKLKNLRRSSIRMTGKKPLPPGRPIWPAVSFTKTKCG
jgi:PAS domain-containing protein